MEITLSKKSKYILSFILILMGICLLGNTNNNPNTFIERIFNPVKKGSGTLYYANFFPMIMIYFGLKWINGYRENRLFMTGNRRVIATILIVLFSGQLITSGIKMGKSMSAGLNSIYYNRKVNNSLFIKSDNEGNANINSIIELENCSEHVQEFYIKILIPENYKEFVRQKELVAKESDFKTDKKFVLRPKEKKLINAEFLESMKEFDPNFNGSISYFELSLINDKEQVKFARKL